jgi:hypothetical protein
MRLVQLMMDLPLPIVQSRPASIPTVKLSGG